MSENSLISVQDLPGFEKLLRELEVKVFGSVETWEEFERRFLRGEGLKPSTYRNQRSGIKGFFEAFLRMRVSPFRVKIEDVEMWFDYLCETRSPETPAVRISQLRAFFDKFCVDYPLCLNPFRRLNEKLAKKFRVPQRERKEIRFLRSDELERLFKFLIRIGQLRYYYLYVLTRFLFNSGLRIGEATQLRWKDFERYNDRDRVDRWRVWFVGKARSSLVPQKVPDKCVELMLRLWSKRFGRHPLPEEWVWFVPPMRCNVQTPSTKLTPTMAWGMYKELSDLVNESELFPFKVKFWCHFWRHALAVYLRDERGYDPRDIQLILRHKDISTTTASYFHDYPKNPDDYAF
jgi:integrase